MGKAYQDQAFNADTTGFILAPVQESMFEIEVFWIVLRMTACSGPIEPCRVVRNRRRRAVTMTEEQVIEIRRLAGGACGWPKPFSERRKAPLDVCWNYWSLVHLTWIEVLHDEDRVIMMIFIGLTMYRCITAHKKLKQHRNTWLPPSTPIEGDVGFHTTSLEPTSDQRPGL